MQRIAVSICIMLALAGTAYGVVVSLPNQTQTTTFTATVSEQADVTVPANVAWTVSNVSASAASASQSVSATTVVLNNLSKLRIEIAPDAANFTAPSGGTVTWASSDISWAGTWTNGTANNTSMSGVANTFVKLVDMTAANSASLSTADLVFTLAAKATVDRGGAHTLAATWKFSSF